MKLMEILANLTKKKSEESGEDVPEVVPVKQWTRAPLVTIDVKRRYFADMDTSAGVMRFELFPTEAPVAVNNFVYLAREGLYDDCQFHRVIRDFMIQGGCPYGTGDGGAGYYIHDEPVRRSYVRGTLAMANAGPNTNSSQFFIVHGDNIGLPPNYTIFGLLVDGEAVLHALANAPVMKNQRGEESWPMDRLAINGINIDPKHTQHLSLIHI